MNFLKKKNTGFTIIELLTVITIIGLMSVITWVNYSDFNRKFSLDRSANQTAQEIRKVLEKAMSAEIPGDATEDSFQGGYGVLFEVDADSYDIFIDIDNNGRFNSTDDEILEEIFFESGVKIESVNLFGGPGCVNNYKSAVFLSPDPIIFIGGKIGPNTRCDEMEVVLIEEQLGITKKIIVNRVGLIEIED